MKKLLNQTVKDVGRNPFVLGLCLVTVVILLNARSLSIGFLTDDYWLLGTLVDRGVVLWGGWTTGSSFYRPLVMLTLWLNFTMGGVHPFAYHLFNICFHVVNVVLLFVTLSAIVRIAARPTTKSPPSGRLIALVLASIFAVHPANAHDVAWISGRTDLLSATFILLTFYALVEFEDKKKRIWQYGSLASFVLALCSKEIAVVVPFAAAALLTAMSVVQTNAASGAISVRSELKSRFKQCRWLFFIDVLYLLTRVLMFRFSDPTIKLTTIRFNEFFQFVTKSIFLIVSPLDPMSAYKALTGSSVPAILITVIAGIIGLILLVRYFKKPFGTFLILFGIVCITTAFCFFPMFLGGTLAPRMIYIPLLVLFQLLIPIIIVAERPASTSRIDILLFAFVTGIVLIYAFSYRSDIRQWQRASHLEDKIVQQIVSQLDDSNKPIVVLNYPQRVNQAAILYCLPYTIYFAQHREFGRNDSVYTGFCTVASSFQEMGTGIEWMPLNAALTRFTLRSNVSTQSFYADPFGSTTGIQFNPPVLGDSISNRFLFARVLAVGAARHIIAVEATVRDVNVYSRAQIFLFQDKTMRRIR